MTNTSNLKRKFKHKMLREIFEQPDVVMKNILAHLDLKKNKIIFNEFDIFAGNFKKIKRFIFLGCGTSFHASLFGNHIFEQITGFPCEFEMADEFNRRQTVIEPNTAFIIISQSGETAEALKAAKKTRDKKALVIAITNKPKSSLSKLADINILNNANPEKAVAATKTFTSSLALIILLALFIKKFLKKSYNIGSAKIIKELKLLPAKMAEALKTEAQIIRVAKKYKQTPVFIVLGENYSYPIALEIALKIKETSYVEAEAIAAGEFKHGPMALVGRDLPIIFVCLKDNYYPQNLKIMKEIKKLGGEITVISNFVNSNLKKTASYIIQIPKMENILSPLAAIIPGQVLAYYLSIAKGNNPDSPRHLTKFVSK